MLCCARASHRVATALLALGLQLLVNGIEVEDACRLIVASAAYPLAAWLDHVARFREVAWQRPVPLDGARARATSIEKHRVSEAARQAGLDAIEEAGREGLWDFMKGRDTRPYLFHDTAPVGRLRQAVARADAPGVRSWLQDHRDLERLLDNATTAGLKAADSELLGERIEQPRRESCIKRLRSVLVGAKAWLETSPQQPPDNELWEPTVELARGLRQSAAAFAMLVSDSRQRWAIEARFLVELSRLVDPLLNLES